MMEAVKTSETAVNFYHTTWRKIERRGWVISTVYSYSPGPDFKSRPGDRYPDWGFSSYSSVPTGKCRDSTLKLGQDSSLPKHFQFIIHVLPFRSTLFGLSCWKCVVKWTTKKHMLHARRHDNMKCDILKCKLFNYVQYSSTSWELTSVLLVSNSCLYSTLIYSCSLESANGRYHKSTS
jgi:hypothetical protein